MRIWYVAAAIWAVAGGAWAEDRALILGNAGYLDAPAVPGARSAMGAATALRAAGFTTLAVADQDGDGMRRRLSELLAGLGPDDRVVIVLAGHFAQGAGETWFLGTRASRPDIVQAGAQGVELSAVLGVAAELPGRSVVLLGASAGPGPLGRGLQAGIDPPEVPQGVAVIRGDAQAVADFAARQIGRRAVSLPVMLAAVPGLQGSGFLPQGAFRPAGAPPPAPPPAPAPVDRGEALAADLARRTGTLAAWQDYLRSYPAGLHAAEARAEIARITAADPAERARVAEEALGLTRDQRRAIQRNLQTMGFDPRGIDGVFGAGSRAAIASWQAANGEQALGFVTRDQILRLAAQAERRAAEQAAAEAARRAEAERLDRIWWEETGAKGDEAGLRAYLNRYPRGLFAEVATARLTAIEQERGERSDREAWARARRIDTAAAYRDYLAAFPRGRFEREARARLAELDPRPVPLPQPVPDGPSRDEIAAAERAEAALNLGTLPRVLIERRLADLGFDPGNPDGTFDRQTRQAIRAFQTSRNQPATGYLDQGSMLALLAGGVVPGR